MNRRFTGRLARFALLAGLAAVVSSSCGKNRVGTILDPSGPKPIAAHPGGQLYGRLLYDPVNFPDLTTPPFPPTYVSLFRNGNLVAVDTMPAVTDTFRFPNLTAGYYSYSVRSRVFRARSAGPLRVVESPRLVDDLGLGVNADSLQTVTLYVVGKMPGFGVGAIETSETLMLGINLGVWTYPNDFSAPIAIPAGTYRFKFVTDATDPRGTIGWGGDSTVVLSAPVNNARVSFGSGDARDLKVTFPTTGFYTFDLDERREVFSVRLMPPTARMAARRIR